MGKRSAFARIDKDLYRTTDPKPVSRLLPWLRPGASFVEPCVGWGDLVGPLMRAGHACNGRYDVVARYPGVEAFDARCFDAERLRGADYIITNPPWSRDVLHELIDVLPRLAPTWLLFDADWMHTRHADGRMRHCTAIVSVGRVKWMRHSAHAAKDNCCWYLFDSRSIACAGPVFLRRAVA
ncbi:MAG: hypothetical protein CMN87_12195 [Stappia sp.]|uniref:hypothetical protein n=1 Tax=Stappia sp. TaxID=1870903 RepID=UPI000C509D6A|nr:hypothetical protein [Stappia sp.]MAB00123.1 hypothetical protein [Stappia sp.]MBM20762.1 hypothetical protein [Stappia sp.]